MSNRAQNFNENRPQNLDDLFPLNEPRGAVPPRGFASAYMSAPSPLPSPLPEPVAMIATSPLRANRLFAHRVDPVSSSSESHPRNSHVSKSRRRQRTQRKRSKRSKRNQRK